MPRSPAVKKPGSVTSDRKTPFLIGSDKFAGFSKLIEEMGELAQVIGKTMGFGKFGIHWDGKPLKRSMEEEVADVLAAADFVIAKNHLNRREIEKRRKEKLKKFRFWHKNVQKGRDPRDGGK